MPKFGSMNILGGKEDVDREMNAADFLYNLTLRRRGFDSKFGFGHESEYAGLSRHFGNLLYRVYIVAKDPILSTGLNTGKYIRGEALDCLGEINRIKENLLPGQKHLIGALETLHKKLDVVLTNEPKDQIDQAFQFFKQFSDAKHYAGIKNELRKDLTNWEEHSLKLEAAQKASEAKEAAESEQFQRALNTQISNIFSGFKKVVAEIDRDLDLENPDFRKKLAPQEVERLRIIKIKINDFLDKEQLPEDVRKLKLLPQVIGEYGRELEDVTRRYQEKYQQRFEAGQSALTRLANWIKNIFSKKQVPNPIEVEMSKTKKHIEKALADVQKGMQKLDQIKKPEKKKPEA